MGHAKHDGLTIPGRIVLARELPFTVGRVAVDPATRQLRVGNDQETLEPRVMQVLVALYRANTVLSRDDLIEQCWAGCIVSDDAINRVVSRLRHLSAKHQGGFQIKTITKVGYQLIEKQPAGPPTPVPEPVHPAPPPARVDRRALLAGGLLTAAAGVSIGAWKLGLPPFAQHINPQARALFERGQEANRQGWIETGDQARNYFEQAVALDPKFADAWGALALQMQMATPDDMGELAIAYRARSAAWRALALDPQQREARVALAMLPAWFRRWRAKEEALLAALDNYPAFPALTMHYGIFLSQVARFDESIRMLERTIANWPYAPEPPNHLIYALCGARRLVEAETLSENALRRWPRHPSVWSTRMALLTYSGRADAALRMAADVDNRPRGIDPQITTMTAIAQALTHRRPADVELAVDTAMQSTRASIANVPTAVRLFTALAENDRIFPLLDAYLFRRGPLAPAADPITPFTHIYTDSLFHPYSRGLWTDPRFAALTKKIGLDDYWRQIGFTPPFRR